MTARDSLDRPVRPRVFWQVFGYECDTCGLRIPFYLEDGCEGPRSDRTVMRVARAGPKQGQQVPWTLTPSGRLVVPVPFIAGGCPRCQGEPPWTMDGPCLVHVRWNEDRVLAGFTETVPDGAARFHYPDAPNAEHACGVPVFGATIEPRR